MKVASSALRIGRFEGTKMMSQRYRTQKPSFEAGFAADQDGGHAGLPAFDLS
jgi:hypothetical protein